MKRSRIKMLCLVSVITTILFASGPSSAYFWAGDPTDWGHDDEPDGPEDGHGFATIQHEQGAACNVTLFGGFSKGAPHSIDKTEEEAGMTCLWVISYFVKAEIYLIYDARATVTLELFFWENNDGNLVDTDTASAVATIIPPQTSDQDQGWLYVWHDGAYADGDQYKLKATASCTYFIHGGWVDFMGSPSITSVYFVINEV